MTREIKFRGKRIDKGKWLYGDLIHIDGKPLINDHTAHIGFDRAFVNPDTIGQYTGFKAKHGKEIYEGDIIRYVYDLRNYDKEIPMSVVWCNGCFMAYNEKRDEYLNCAPTLERTIIGSECVHEIIGNIYDNPELLQQSLNTSDPTC